MTFSIATWNINSVRLRIELVKRFLTDWRPDILCLQETKCPPDAFPHRHFQELGYDYIVESGQKSYHGVAIISRLPILTHEVRSFCDKNDCRYIVAMIANPAQQEQIVAIHNFYIPAGGDIADPLINDKFAHKLQFLDELTAWSANEAKRTDRQALLVGDLNVAPYENDVWSHKQLLTIISHTPAETTALEQARMAGNWVDVMRQHIPLSEKLYTWWSYRARDWELSDRGRRLDHIWSTADLAKTCSSIEIAKPIRGWDRPSDHVPVLAYFSTGNLVEATIPL